MNRTQKFALNSLTSMISQIVVMAAGMITPRLMIATYGSEMNGLVSSLNQFISYITLVEAGIGGAAIYSLYKPLAEEDHARISSIVVAAKKSYRQAGYIFSAGIFILAVVYGLLSNAESVTFGTIFTLAIILGINGCFDFFFVAGDRVLLTADQRNYVISFATIINTVLRTVIICVMTAHQMNILLLYGCASALVIIKAGIIVCYSHNNYTYLDKKAVLDRGAMEKRWEVIYQQILGIIQTGAPTVLATILLNLVSVSVYSIYNMVISGLNGVLSIFISGLPAGFGDLIARREETTLRKTVSEFEVAYYYILSIVYGLAFALIMPFVSVYTKGLSDANYYYPLLGAVIVLNGLLYNIKTPQSMLIVSAGMYKETRWQVTIQGLIIIVFGAIGGRLAGMVGIMLGSCLSNLYRTIDLLFFTPKYITHGAPLKSLLRMLLVMVNIIVIYGLSLVYSPECMSYLQWFKLAIIYGVWAVVVVTASAYAFEKKEFISVMKRMLSLVKRKV